MIVIHPNTTSTVLRMFVSMVNDYANDKTPYSGDYNVLTDFMKALVNVSPQLDENESNLYKMIRGILYNLDFLDAYTKTGVIQSEYILKACKAYNTRSDWAQAYPVSNLTLYYIDL